MTNDTTLFVSENRGGEYTHIVAKISKMLQQKYHGMVLLVEVLHDDWCPMLRRGGASGFCTCNPEFAISDTSGQKIMQIKSGDL